MGYLAARKELVRELVDLKRLTCLCTPEVNERLVHQVLQEGHYRKHLGRLNKRLQAAREHTLSELDRCGLRPYVEPEHGMFVWARFDHVENSADLSGAALDRDIIGFVAVLLAENNYLFLLFASLGLLLEALHRRSVGLIAAGLLLGLVW